MKSAPVVGEELSRLGASGEHLARGWAHDQKPTVVIDRHTRVANATNDGVCGCPRIAGGPEGRSQPDLRYDAEARSERIERQAIVVSQLELRCHESHGTGTPPTLRRVRTRDTRGDHRPSHSSLLCVEITPVKQPSDLRWWGAALSGRRPRRRKARGHFLRPAVEFCALRTSEPRHADQKTK
jgi:hypothetical protein